MQYGPGPTRPLPGPGCAVLRTITSTRPWPWRPPCWNTDACWKAANVCSKCCTIAGNEMSSLHQQLSGAGNAVLLTDARGVILNCVTAPAERKIFERAGLWLGADWSEAWKAPTVSVHAWWSVSR
jgi:hypothetical protein